MKPGSETTNVSGKAAVVVRAKEPLEARFLAKRYLERERKHAVSFNGMAFECFRCGASAVAMRSSPNSSVWKLVGGAVTTECAVQS